MGGNDFYFYFIFTDRIAYIGNDISIGNGASSFSLQHCAGFTGQAV